MGLTKDKTVLEFFIYNSIIKLCSIENMQVFAYIYTLVYKETFK